MKPKVQKKSSENVSLTLRDTGVFRSSVITLNLPEEQHVTQADRALIAKAFEIGGDLPAFELDAIESEVECVLGDPESSEDMREDAQCVQGHLAFLRCRLEDAARVIKAAEVADQEIAKLKAPTSEFISDLSKGRYYPDESMVLSREARCCASSLQSLPSTAVLLGMFLQRMKVRWAEPFAAKGREHLIAWRGLTFKVDPTERKILNQFHDRDQVDIHGFVRVVWGELYNDDNRDKYDQATYRVRKTLKRAGSRFRVHIDGERVIVLADTDS